LDSVAALLTVEDLCSALRCSRTTVWRLMKRGDLRVLRLTDGGPPRFRAEDVEEFIRARFAMGEPATATSTAADVICEPVCAAQRAPRRGWP
jgi:excisionase family DNA binding protein